MTENAGEKGPTNAEKNSQNQKNASQSCAGCSNAGISAAGFA